ncbi:hypothetical protein B0H13DRAFT_1898879 [Mycena leptocephala]|nr:hypothetical protein B0H13DRAFT_1898879 [Mycena leptocephala]
MRHPKGTKSNVWPGDTPEIGWIFGPGRGKLHAPLTQIATARAHYHHQNQPDLIVFRRQTPAPNISESALDSTQILSRGLALWAVSERWERRHGGFACCDARLRQGHVMEHHRVQELRIYADCGTSQRGGRQDKREDERKLERRDLWRAVPAWIEMWNERPKTKFSLGLRSGEGGWKRTDPDPAGFKQGRGLEQQGEHDSGKKIDVDLNGNGKGQGIGKQDMMLRHEGREGETQRSGDLNERSRQIPMGPPRYDSPAGVRGFLAVFKQGRSLKQQGEHESGKKVDVDLKANRKGQGIGKQDMTLRHEGAKAEMYQSLEKSLGFSARNKTRSESQRDRWQRDVGFGARLRGAPTAEKRKTSQNNGKWAIRRERRARDEQRGNCHIIDLRGIRGPRIVNASCCGFRGLDEGRANCDGGREREMQEVAMQPSGRGIRRLPFFLSSSFSISSRRTHSRSWTLRSTARSMTTNLEVTRSVLLPVRCGDLVVRRGGMRREWGAWVADGVGVGEQLTDRTLCAMHPRHFESPCSTPCLASTPSRWRLQFSLALVLVFQHSQQPASPEFDYHADLLGDPLLLFHVLVSLLSLQPRHRPTPGAYAQAAAASFHSRPPAITLLPHSALLPRMPHLFLFSVLTLQALPVLLHSCTPLLTLLLRCADTYAPACPLDLTPLVPYALHSVRLPPSPIVSIMIMISIPHPALLAPRASRSLGLLRLELFGSCFRFRSGSLFLVARIYAIRSESIPDPPLFIPVLTFFKGIEHPPRGVLTRRDSCLLLPSYGFLCASSTDLNLGT